MPTSADYRSYANQMADKYGIPRPLFSGLITQESGFNQYDKSGAPLRSSSGAIGLGQLMPGTAADLGVDPFDWRQNLEGAADYFSQQLRRFGRADLALSAYNSGPGGSEQYGAIANNPETQNYVSSILGKLKGFDWGDAAMDAALDAIPGVGSVPGLDGSDIIKGGTSAVTGGVKSVVDFLTNFFSKDTLVRTVAIILGLGFLIIAVISMITGSKTVQAIAAPVTKAVGVAAKIAA